MLDQGGTSRSDLVPVKDELFLDYIFDALRLPERVVAPCYPALRLFFFMHE